MRLLLIFVALAIAVIIPFLIWGEGFEATVSADALTRYGRWAWLAGVMLLIADLVLPVPSTTVISGLGYLYGILLGGVLGAAGSFLSGAAAYFLCRRFGENIAVRIAGERDLMRGRRFLSRSGGWLAIALSRWLPVFPEVLACLAGLVRMPTGRFFSALACGSVPLGFFYAAIGTLGKSTETPYVALALSAVVPPVLWIIVSGRLRRHGHRPSPSSGKQRDSC